MVRVSVSLATSSAITTVGRIGVNMAAPTVELDVINVSKNIRDIDGNTALSQIRRQFV